MLNQLQKINNKMTIESRYQNLENILNVQATIPANQSKLSVEVNNIKFDDYLVCNPSVSNFWNINNISEKLNNNKITGEVFIPFTNASKVNCTNEYWNITDNADVFYPPANSVTIPPIDVKYLTFNTPESTNQQSLFTFQEDENLFQFRNLPAGYELKPKARSNLLYTDYTRPDIFGNSTKYESNKNVLGGVYNTRYSNDSGRFLIFKSKIPELRIVCCEYADAAPKQCYLNRLQNLVLNGENNTDTVIYNSQTDTTNTFLANIKNWCVMPYCGFRMDVYVPNDRPELLNEPMSTFFEIFYSPFSVNDNIPLLIKNNYYLNDSHFELGTCNRRSMILDSTTKKRLLSGLYLPVSNQTTNYELQISYDNSINNVYVFNFNHINIIPSYVNNYNRDKFWSVINTSQPTDLNLNNGTNRSYQFLYFVLNTTDGKSFTFDKNKLELRLIDKSLNNHILAESGISENYYSSALLNYSPTIISESRPLTQSYNFVLSSLNSRNVTGGRVITFITPTIPIEFKSSIYTYGFLKSTTFIFLDTINAFTSIKFPFNCYEVFDINNTYIQFENNYVKFSPIIFNDPTQLYFEISGSRQFAPNDNNLQGSNSLKFIFKIKNQGTSINDSTPVTFRTYATSSNLIEPQIFELSNTPTLIIPNSKRSFIIELTGGDASLLSLVNFKNYIKSSNISTLNSLNTNLINIELPIFLEQNNNFIIMQYLRTNPSSPPQGYYQYSNFYKNNNNFVFQFTITPSDIANEYAYKILIFQPYGDLSSIAFAGIRYNNANETKSTTVIIPNGWYVGADAVTELIKYFKILFPNMTLTFNKFTNKITYTTTTDYIVNFSQKLDILTESNAQLYGFPQNARIIFNAGETIESPDEIDFFYKSRFSFINVQLLNFSNYGFLSESLTLIKLIAQTNKGQLSYTYLNNFEKTLPKRMVLSNLSLVLTDGLNNEIAPLEPVYIQFLIKCFN